MMVKKADFGVGPPDWDLGSVLVEYGIVEICMYSMYSVVVKTN